MELTEKTSTASIDVAKPKGKLWIPIVFTLTSFIGASLLFIVEPLIAKMLLPEFGGSSSVWTLSTFFFQAIMLVGYLYIHFTSKSGPRRQPLWQLGLVIPALLFLPLSLPAMSSIPSQEPFTRILLTLLVLVGLPFLVISTTGPLIQKWYSWTNGPRNDDPYFIYAASNSGSFIGLLAYPFIIEPFVSLEAQRNLWSIGFVAFLLMVAFCGSIVFKQNRSIPASLKQAAGKVGELTEAVVNKLSLKRQFWWVFLAFIPASLQLGLVSYITTDIASFPLLWIVPLTIYLATMIAAFARKSRKPPRWAILSGAVFAGASIYMAVFATSVNSLFSMLSTMSLFMVTLALVSYAAHGSLAADRPETAHLTKYFVLISLGGAIGGAFNGLIAPFIFKTPVEFPIVLALSLLMLTVFLKDKTHTYTLVALVTLFAILTATTGGFNSNKGSIAQGRSFYGAWNVSNVSINDGEQMREFSHGTTSHGSQILSEDRRGIPTSYYALGGPLSNLVDEALQNDKPEITVIGLGTGAMAAYANADTTMNFIEVDQQVIEVAENPDMFTYLSDAKERGASIQSVLGDGRKMAEEIEDGSQDLIAIDAFSSDSIPVHLLTEEAFAIYKSKLKPGGIIAVHISNRIFDLEPVVANNGEKIGLTSLIKSGKGNPESLPNSATWMALTDDSSAINRLKGIPQLPVEGEEVSPDSGYDLWLETSTHDRLISWTDDHSSILEAIIRD